MLSKTSRPTISSLFSKYTYNVALLYPAAFAISLMEVAVIPFSINIPMPLTQYFLLCTALGSFSSSHIPLLFDQLNSQFNYIDKYMDCQSPYPHIKNRTNLSVHAGLLSILPSPKITYPLFNLYNTLFVCNLLHCACSTGVTFYLTTNYLFAI